MWFDTLGPGGTMLTTHTVGLQCIISGTSELAPDRRVSTKANGRVLSSQSELKLSDVQAARGF